MLQGARREAHVYGEVALKPMGYFGHRRRKSICSCEFLVTKKDWGSFEHMILKRQEHENTGMKLRIICVLLEL
jgi:hypothetical protein